MTPYTTTALKLLFAAPLMLFAYASEAKADTIVRYSTSAQPIQQCRDFTKTTTYVNRTVSEQGTACLYPDGLWHVVTADGAPVLEQQVHYVVEQPDYFYTVRRPLPVYYPVPRYNYNPGRWDRGRGNGPGNSWGNNGHWGHDNDHDHGRPGRGPRSFND